MRILQIHNRYRHPGGEDGVAAAEARLLEEGGHVVRRVLADNPVGMASVPALALSTWNPGVTRRVRGISSAFAPDIAHVHNTWFALTAAAVAGVGCPAVMTLHNFRLTCANARLFREGAPCRLCVEGSAVNAVKYGCYRGRLLSIPAALNVGVHRWRGTWQRHVATFVTLTEFARGLMIESGLPAERVVMSSNFVEDPGSRANRPSQSDRLLFVGRLEVEKGAGLLAEAIRRSNQDFQWCIVGDGPLRGEFEAIPGVELRGWVSRQEVDTLMKTSRAMVLPSIWFEGQPISILEAFAAGLPVLGTNHGGIGETVSELGSDFLVPPGDIAALAEAIDSLGSDHHVDTASLVARRLFETRYSRAQGLSRLQEIYAAAIALGPGPYPV